MNMGDGLLSEQQLRTKAKISYGNISWVKSRYKPVKPLVTYVDVLMRLKISWS